MNAKKKKPTPRAKSRIPSIVRKRASAKPSSNGDGIRWLFPPNDLGQDQGFHDAGVETFKGNFYRFLAREIIQNSLDARLDHRKPVTVTFEAIDVPRSDIPDMDSLEDAFKRCSDYWTEPVAKSFFGRAAKLTSQPAIPALRIGDFNTTGVVGSDDDHINDKNWYSLIRCSGSSSKLGGEGGSYGIGKNAPFAASQLRTVLYSTNTGTSEVAFQGVARLATHRNDSGGKVSNVGFLGGVSGQSIRKQTHIPTLLQRAERGTDVVILGFIAEESWQDQLKLSVLENFWPAIHFGDLQVQIGDLDIRKKNLPELLEESMNSENFTAHLYYRSFTNPTHSFSQKLPYLHEVELKISTGDVDLPKKIAMVRKSGMVIWHRPTRGSAFPFCGVFMCRNEKGNALLRAMEPPRHDDWDPNFPEKGNNKHIEKEFVEYIRQCVRGLATKDDAKVIEVDEVSRFLPDDDEFINNSEGAYEQSENSKIEGFPEKPKKPYERTPLPLHKINSLPTSANRQVEDAPDDLDPDDGDEADDSDSDSSNGTAADAVDERGGGGNSTFQSIPITFRSFSLDDEGERYCVTIRPDISGKLVGTINLLVVGDDSREALKLKGAKVMNGKKLSFQANGKIGPIDFAPRKAVKLEVELLEPGKLAMEVVAHEA